jgi:hypothetical protein
MIVELTVYNRLDQPIVVNSDSATGQPLAPQQSVQVVAELRPDKINVGHITLYVDPQQ